MAKRAYETVTYHKFDRYIAASDSFAQTLVRDFRIRQSRVSVVHPGVDTNRFHDADRAQARLRLGLDPAKFTFVCVRRLERRMGISLAIEAMSAVPEAQLLIVGTGSLRTSLEAHSEALGFGDRVKFAGSLDAGLLPVAYQACDVAVVPTIALEGFGMIVLEAYATGRPVIASRIGGLPSALGPFADSWMVEPNSPGELRERMVEATRSRPDEAVFKAYAESRSISAMAREVEEAVFGATTW
jgi:glycosyltransferase involved in cell wall biosynthesis